MKGCLKLMVLNNLSKKEMSGYSLIKKIEDDTGWKPSTGSIYPILEEFLENGQVRVKEDERKRVYSLTQDGRIKLDELAGFKIKILDNLIANCKIFDCLFDEYKLDIFFEIFDRLKKGEVPLKEINPEVNDFRMAVFRLLKEDKIKGNQKEIKNIIKEAIDKLKKIK